MQTLERYVTFTNIDCYAHARSVLDAMGELFASRPEAKNLFWERFEAKLPDNYADTPVDELGRDILYQVCSNVFYFEELFEQYDFEAGLTLLQKAEFDCC